MKKPLTIFVATVVVLLLVFFLLPINIFDGEIIYLEEHREFVVKAPLSLSYFIGLGYDEADMVNIKSYYLTTKGIVMAFIFIFGFPALLAYRIYLKQNK